MASNSVATPHSCQFCRKLVLYNAFLPEKDSMVALSATSRKFQDWFEKELVQLGPTHKRGNSLLGFQDGMVLFDFTIAEVRTAGIEGCSLCSSLVRCVTPSRSVAKRPETSLFACRVENSYLFF